MFFAGIDAGSRAIKAVIIDDARLAPVASGSIDQGVRQEALASSLYESLLSRLNAGPDSVGYIVATGYGRNLISFSTTTITEITCHARGINHTFPGVKTVVEIGGQDSKVIRVDARGVVRDFAMNDRCAAGTGRFLEIVANRLEKTLDALGDMAAACRKPASISSMCAVFAETEIIGLLASGVPPEDIVAGVQLSVARRVTAMAGRVVDDPVIFTGGVALIPGMKAAMETALDHPVVIAPEPQYTGALGAALLAAENYKRSG